MEEEIWKHIPGYEEYKVNQSGKIMTISRTVDSVKGYQMKLKSRVIAQFINKDGYKTANVRRRTFLVSRAVALAFIPNPENKRTVNHKDGDKLNNHVSNLEWMTDSENNLHSFRELGRRSGTYGKKGKDSHVSKKTKCLNDGRMFDSATQAAKHYGLGVSSVTTVCTGVQSTTRLGLKFQYI
jgi:hypothetical protein